MSRRTVQRGWSQTKQRAPQAGDVLARAVVTMLPAVNPVDVAATAGDAVATLLDLRRALRRSVWALAADRRAWSVGPFGLCNVRGWASPMR